MNAVGLLRLQFKSAHATQEGTMTGVVPDTAHFRDTGKAIPVGAAYAHSVWGEDMAVSTMLAMKEPLYKSQETGLSEPMPDLKNWDKHEAWYKSVKVDLPKLKKYAQKVYQATDEYLASLKDADLDREMDLSIMGMGKQTLAFVISNFIVLHIANLTGEISAAKGLQGLKGYPF